MQERFDRGVITETRIGAAVVAGDVPGSRAHPVVSIGGEVFRHGDQTADQNFGIAVKPAEAAELSGPLQGPSRWHN